MTSSHWMDIQPTVVWACRAWFAATFPLGLVRELERRLSVTIKRMWAACTCIDDMIVHPAARGGRGDLLISTSQTNGTSCARSIRY